MSASKAWRLAIAKEWLRRLEIELVKVLERFEDAQQARSTVLRALKDAEDKVTEIESEPDE